MIVDEERRNITPLLAIEIEGLKGPSTSVYTYFSPRKHLLKIFPADKPIWEHWVLLGRQVAVPGAQLPRSFTSLVKADRAVQLFHIDFTIPITVCGCTRAQEKTIGFRLVFGACCFDVLCSLPVEVGVPTTSPAEVTVVLTAICCMPPFNTSVNWMVPQPKSDYRNTHSRPQRGDYASATNFSGSRRR